MYKPNSYFTTRFIIGIYETMREAEERQKDFCGKNFREGINGSLTGFHKGEQVITWIKAFVQGSVMEQP